MAEQNGAKLHAEVVGQLATLSKQLVGDRFDMPVELFRQHPDALEAAMVDPGGLLALGNHDSVEFAGLHAGPADRALGQVDTGNPVLHGDGLERAGLDALPASDTFVIDYVNGIVRHVSVPRLRCCFDQNILQFRGQLAGDLVGVALDHLAALPRGR